MDEDAIVTACDVVTFGEALGSIRATGMLRHGGPMSLSLAGAESNVAIGLARLGHSVRWVGRLGADEVGALATRELTAEGIVLDRVVIDPTRPTGIMLVEKRIAEISRVAYYRAGSAAAALTETDLRGSFDASTRVLHISGITPALSPSAAEATLWAARTARELGVTVSLDINYRSALWPRADAEPVLRGLVQYAHIVFASDDELSLVVAASEAEAASQLLAAGAAEVVIKRGADGASAWSEHGETRVLARTVTVVDTVGAGDAFTAGYLSAMLDGGSIQARLERGAILGAFAVSDLGDWESLPRRDELDLLDRSSGHTIR